MSSAGVSTVLPEHIREVFGQSICLYTKPTVEAALDEMAVEISDELGASNPIFLCVMIGGLVPMGNLLPRLDFPLEVDYVHASRYRNDLVGKDLQWFKKPSINLQNRTVVLVDDILDGGITLNAIIQYSMSAGASKVYSAVLVDKKDARLENGLQSTDFCGLEVANHYVFGYGMDYKGYLRNAPGIYRVNDEQN